jgi:predicted ester cyclase
MSDAKQLIRNFYAHLDANRGDFSALSRHVHPALRFHVPGASGPLTLAGFRAFVDDFYAAFPDLRHDIGFQLSEGNRVATRMIVTGTHRGRFMEQPATNRHVTFSANTLHAFEEGRLIDYWFEGDLLGLKQQLVAA